MKTCCVILLSVVLSLPCAASNQRHTRAGHHLPPGIVSLEGVDAMQQSAQRDVDPQGVVGTQQFFEWTNGDGATQGAMQAWDKVTLLPVWTQNQDIAFPWIENGMSDCETVEGDGQIIFDSLASRWVIGAHSSSTSKTGPYFYCVAVSSTDDLTTATWYTYEFALDPYLGESPKTGHPNFPDWPKIATWWNAYFVTIDVLDPDNLGGNAGDYMPLGIMVCALDRTDMLLNNPATYQCLTDPSPIPPNPTIADLYLKHSVIPADIDGSTAPPTNRDEFLLSIQNPPNDGKTTTSSAINLWDFHLDWTNSQNSSLTNSPLIVPTYTPGCYTTTRPLDTFCVPQPTTRKSGEHLDSVGDRLMPRLAYRNFGSYESFLIAHTIQPGKSQQTALRWYELRDNGSGSPSLNRSGTLSFGKTTWRFVPGIDEDQIGNAAIGYSLSSTTVHPSIYASSWNLSQKGKPSETQLWIGSGDWAIKPFAVGRWGSYTGMSVDPVDGCTLWYVNEYFSSTQTGKAVNWNTRISNFKLPSCQ